MPLKIIRIILYIFLFLCIPFVVFGQYDPDSLSYYRKSNNYNKIYSYGKKYYPLFLKQKDTVNLLNYSDGLYIKGVYAFSNGKKNDGIYFLTQSVDILKQVISKNTPKRFYLYFNHLAYYYIQLKDYDHAEKVYKDVVEIKKKIFGTENAFYAASVSDLAITYHNQKKYDQAETLYKEVLDIRKKTLGQYNKFYIQSLYNLGLLYKHSGKIQETQAIFNKIIQINLKEEAVTKLAIEHNYDYSNNNKNLVKKYPFEGGRTEIGSYKRGNPVHEIPFYKKKIQSLTEKEDVDPGVLAYYLHNLGYLYVKTGNIKEAEVYFLKAKKLYKKQNNVIGVGYCLDNLAGIYLDMGITIKSEHLFSQAITIFKENNEENGYAMALNDLGMFYKKRGDFKRAEKYLQRAITIRKELYDIDNEYLLNSLNNLAELYIETGDFNKAKPLLFSTLQSRKINLGVNHPYYALSLFNIGLLYEKQHEYKWAENYFLEALQLREKNLGQYNIAYEETVKHLAIFYLNQKKYRKASLYFEKSLNPVFHRIKEAATYLSTNEMQFFLKELSKFNNHLYSFIFQHPEYSENIVSGLFNLDILTKNLTVRNHGIYKENVNNFEDGMLQNKYRQFKKNKSYLTQTSIKDPNAQPPLQVLDAEELEKSFIRSSSEFIKINTFLSIKEREIVKNLNQGELLIDFISFTLDDKTDTHSEMYGAFLLKRGSIRPKFTYLFNEKELKSVIQNKYRFQSTYDKIYYEKDLENLVIKPFMSDLNGIQSIFLSPTGLTHFVNFSALPSLTGSYRTLGEKYDIHTISSPAEMIRNKEILINKDPKPNILLYGAIDYNNSNFSADLSVDKRFDSVKLSPTQKWSLLNGTRLEIKVIKGLAFQNHFNAVIVDSVAATKKSILQMTGRKQPYVLHLATHGFFFPKPDSISKNRNNLNTHIYKYATDPMIRSGLLFAGANRYWGKPISYRVSDNGILTAKEISNLDLEACQLVIMSACDSGLGDLYGNDGVYGLQRAFKMAGVKNIIMSLWQVPDKQTAELFAEFYKHAFKGKSVHEAFKLAQKKMKTKYSPFYWAGFVLLE